MTGQELRRWRKSHGLTETQAAELCGVSQTLWNLIEAGERRAGVALISKVRAYKGGKTLSSVLGRAPRGPYRPG